MTRSFLVSEPTHKFYLSVDISFGDFNRTIAEKNSNTGNLLIKCEKMKYIGILNECISKVIPNWYLDLKIYIFRDTNTLECISSLIKYSMIGIMIAGIAIPYIPVPIVYENDSIHGLIIRRNDNGKILNLIGNELKIEKDELDGKSADFIENIRQEIGNIITQEK